MSEQTQPSPTKPYACGRPIPLRSIYSRCRLCRKLGIHLETLSVEVKEWLAKYEAKLAAISKPAKKKKRKKKAAAAS